MAVISAILPKEHFSETENRYLQDMPDISFERIENGKYMTDLENYVSDHFAGRTGWIKAKTTVDLLAGKKESNGVYISKSMLIEKVTDPDFTEINKSIKAINNFAQNNPEVKTYFMLAPTSGGIYSDQLPKNAPNLNQNSFIENIYSQLSDTICSVDAFSTLDANKDKYIYYRTDHHWTSLGAYLAYTACAGKLGISKNDISKYDIQHVADDFEGTLYSKALYDGVQPDAMDIYYYKGSSNVKSYDVSDGKDEKSYSSIYFNDYLDKKDKYSVFTGPNVPLATINTNVKNGKSIVIFKDSYANSFVPFLTEDYSKITMIDLRYINTSYNNIINMSEYDDALFLYNVSTFTTDNNIKKLDF